ncbi:MAG: hypothetical protein ACR2H6_09160 [Pyrinomonadaceae bacterium]
MQKLTICVLLMLVLSTLGTTAAQNASKRMLVGNLNRNFDGCGCFFKFRGTRKNSPKVMFAEFGQNNAWMNIDGRDVQLKLVKEIRGERERVGSNWTRTIAVRDISVTSTYVATRVCAPNDETCESTDYDATFVVKKGRRSQTVRAFGWCGC